MICQFSGTQCRYMLCPLWREEQQDCRFVLAVDKILEDDPGKLPVNLTPREREVFNLMAQGCNNQDIGSALQMKPSTVKNHVSGIKAKLNAKNRVETVVIGLKQGIVSL